MPHPQRRRHAPSSRARPRSAGPAVILTNPPWEKVRAEKREFHLQWWPDMRDQKKYKTQDLDSHLRRLYRENPDAQRAWERYAAFYDFYREYFKSGRFFWQQGKGDTNFYKLFLEHYLHLAQPGGWIVPLVQGGIYGDPGCKDLRQTYWNKTRWREMLGFENRWPIFENVDSRMKIALMVAVHGSTTSSLKCFFMAHAPDSPLTRSRIELDWARIERLYPETLQLPEVASPVGLSVLEKVRMFPQFDAKSPWGIDWMNELHRSGDDRLFSSDKTRVPLLEGGLFHQFRWDYSPPEIWLKEREFAAHLDSKAGTSKQRQSTRLAFREVARNTDVRTVIAARLPPGPGVAHTAWVERVGTLDPSNQTLLLGILNSLVVDWIARRSVGMHVTKEIMTSIRVPPPQAFMDYKEKIMKVVTNLEEAGGPYDAARAQLDAIVARVYGLTPDEVAYLWTDFRVLAGEHPDYIHKVVKELEAFPKKR